MTDTTLHDEIALEQKHVDRVYARLARLRAGYVGEPNAQKPPFVLKGDALGTTRFWHGEKRTRWAEDWVKLWTDGAGTFTMTDCEDQGILDVLDLYARAGKVDSL